MSKTNVFLLVPTYLGTTGTIQAAYDIASNVDKNGPIQFHLVDYPEENPRPYLNFEDEPDITGDIEPSDAFSVSSMNTMASMSIEEDSSYQLRHYIELPGDVIRRMEDAEYWFFNEKKGDPENSLVILLNPYGNSHNYFCGPSPKSSNVAFIQTTHYATEVTVAPHVPLAYEFFAAALRFRAFNQPDYQDVFVHYEDRGCVNDFFREIEHIKFKIQSADVCDECYSHIMDQDISRAFLDHVYAGLNSVRELQNSFTRARRANRPLTVRIENKKVHFVEIQAVINFPPKELALFKFYMNHPEGVAYKDFKDHETQLRYLYAQSYNGDPDAYKDAVDGVVGKWLMQDGISQTTSKINRKIKEALQELAHWHIISGERDEPKKIKAAWIS